MTVSRTLTLRAHAKVNRHLVIGPRRRDGYHDLETLFQEVSLHDTLRCRLRLDGRLTLGIRGARITAGPDNLILRALASLKASLRTPLGMHVDLVKRIPMGAGLGGGSSDAAQALLAGWRLWARPSGSARPPLRLFRLARGLGADVPFFLRGGAAWASGIGERLRPVKGLPREHMVLVYPRVHSATPQAYGELDRWRTLRRVPRPGRLRAKPPRELRAFLGGAEAYNSFEPVVSARLPAVRRALAALTNAGLSKVMMSGSGSAVFGLARSSVSARAAARALSGRGWDVHVVHTL